MALFKTPDTQKTTAGPKRDDGERQPDVPMPIGTHEATVVFVMPGETKTGKVRFGIKFADAEERTSWYNLVAPDGSNPKHTRMFYDTAAKLGLGPKFLDADDTDPQGVADALVGAKALVTVADEAYQGKVYRKVTWLDAPEPF